MAKNTSSITTVFCHRTGTGILGDEGFHVYAQDGSEYPSEYRRDDRGCATLEPGQSHRGFVFFEVPIGARTVKLVAYNDPNLTWELNATALELKPTVVAFDPDEISTIAIKACEQQLLETGWEKVGNYFEDFEPGFLGTADKTWQIASLRAFEPEVVKPRQWPFDDGNDDPIAQWTVHIQGEWRYHDLDLFEGWEEREYGANVTIMKFAKKFDDSAGFYDSGASIGAPNYTFEIDGCYYGIVTS